MLDELRAIDTSAIEELCTIKEEQELLQSRLAAMDEKKGDVSEAVFERVRQDYETRHESLEQQARPLKEQARGEYAKLRALHSSCQQALEAAVLDKEELEFRNGLGEFEEDEFSRRMKECEELVEQRTAELEEAEKLRGRFVEAFHSEEELEQPEPEPGPPGPEEQEEEALDQAGSDEPDEHGDGEEDRPPSQTEAEPVGAEATMDASSTEPGLALDDQPTEAGPVVETGATEPGAALDEGATEVGVALDLPQPEAGGQVEAAAAADDPEGATMMLRGSRLQAVYDDGSTEEFVLGVEPTPIGRAPDNAIQLKGDTISRYHAQVVMDADGYLLRDLGSENGTLVNGERVREHRLTAGDEVQVGQVLLVFHDD